MTEPLVIVALPRGAPYSGVVPGSAPMDCDGCRTTVMVSPSSREMMQQHDGPSRVLCMTCWRAAVREDPTAVIEHITPAQAVETEAYVRRN